MRYIILSIFLQWDYLFLYENIPNLFVNTAQYVYAEVSLFVYRMCVRIDQRDASVSESTSHSSQMAPNPIHKTHIKV